MCAGVASWQTMTTMLSNLAFIGFGEAAIAFVEQWGVEASRQVRAFDIKTTSPATAAAKRGDYARFGVVGADSLGEAIRDAKLVISVVTADQALAAAHAAAEQLGFGSLYCDFNSVAPGTKAEAATAIEAAGGRYVDVAVMAPVRPAQLAVPLLVSGPHASEACDALSSVHFSPRNIGGEVGQASTIKMLRSVMVKGMEALTAECFVAADAAGVTAEVARTLNASWPGIDWAEKADYNLERMIVHGLRRASEMQEVAATLETLGIPNDMTRATAAAQRRIGAMKLDPVDGLDAKSASIRAGKAKAA